MEKYSIKTNKNGKIFKLIYLNMSIGLKIKELRKSFNMSQKELSLKINIDNSQLSKIEQGKLTPTLNQVMDISSIFNVPTDWLLSKDNFNNQKIKGDNNIMAGNNVKNQLEDKQLIKQLREQITLLTNQVREKDEQINKLINLLANGR